VNDKGAAITAPFLLVVILSARLFGAKDPYNLPQFFNLSS
jgi:hypothetical protein